MATFLTEYTDDTGKRWDAQKIIAKDRKAAEKVVAKYIELGWMPPTTVVFGELMSEFEYPNATTS